VGKDKPKEESKDRCIPKEKRFLQRKIKKKKPERKTE